MRPLEPGELLEYGQLFVCGCSRVPARDGCNRAITIHGAMLALAIVLAVYSGVLCGVAQLASVPWITLTGFNGTVDDASTFRADDRYALDGSVQSTLCPVAPTLNARCCENPPWHVSPRLTDLAPSADAGAAFAHMQLLGILAQVLWAVAALVLVFLLAPTVRLPPGQGKPDSWTPPVVVRVALLVAFAVTGAILTALRMGQCDDALFAPLAANTTAIVAVAVVAAPSSAADVALLQLQRGAGYSVAAAALGQLASLAGLVLIAGCVCSPRWLWGTRAVYYDEQLAKGFFVTAESLIVVNPCAGSAALEAQLAAAAALRQAAPQQARMVEWGIANAQPYSFGAPPGLLAGAPLPYEALPTHAP